MAETKSNLYPHFVVENNKKPNRFYAFPLLGFIIKCIMLIPVFLEMIVLSFASLFILVISWFVISFTGNYWTTAYKFFLGLMTLGTKVRLFLLGLTDTYPGFGFDTKGLFTLDITKPEKPNRWLAIPLLGLLIRSILLIPYSIFADVLGRGTNIAMIISWFVVLFKGKFPESLYEFEKDTVRVSLASSIYLLGLSDKYPSFAISMNHQTIKIFLIIIGAILSAWNMVTMFIPSDRSSRYSSEYHYKYDYSPDSTIPSDVDSNYKTY